MAKEKRFEKVYSQGAMSTNEIWVDTQTGVQYFYHGGGYGGGAQSSHSGGDREHLLTGGGDLVSGLLHLLTGGGDGL